uniref:Uncharacterized protein n=1 Tax=Physcomitrium patens TaxID=3218 RepID=A0A2K1IDU7_PHYPA|nr:hypothetical protein PHYPA_029595 [Physcomitrium patens]
MRCKKQEPEASLQKASGDLAGVWCLAIDSQGQNTVGECTEIVLRSSPKTYARIATVVSGVKGRWSQQVVLEFAGSGTWWRCVYEHL